MKTSNYNMLSRDIERHGYDVGFLAYVHAMGNNVDTFAKMYNTGPQDLMQTAYRLASDLEGLGYYH